MWRSKAKKVIDEAIAHAEDTTLSERFKKRLRQLGQGINLFNANQLTTELKAIHFEYMEVIYNAFGLLIVSRICVG